MVEKNLEQYSYSFSKKNNTSKSSIKSIKIIKNQQQNQQEIKLVKSEIISCSRRTDIPAFLMSWVEENIKNGYVEVKNPFNNKISYISLDPNDVKAWVWWSKDFKNWIASYKKNPLIFDQYKAHIFNFTINSRSDLEKGLKTTLDERILQIRWLNKRFGIDSIQWRFDPIVIYKIKTPQINKREFNLGFYSNPNDYKITIEKNNNHDKFSNFNIYHNSSKLSHNLQDFEYIASKLSDFGIKEVIFSFATIYKKVIRRMLSRGKIIIDPPLEIKKEILDFLISIANKYNIKFFACNQPDLVGYNGIMQAHCINGLKIQKILKSKGINSIIIAKDKGQREFCGCNISRDIGGYYGIFRCRHSCDYCYARPMEKL
ncbi:MAG: DUF1848 family protein [Promethearchaeota archaeon]